MSFRGRLEHFPLPDLLQFLAGSGKTGTLALTLRFDQGLLVLRQGRIIYGASTSSRQTLGSVLVSQGLIDEDQLASALEEMLDTARERRLGNILVESGAIDAETLTEVLRDQVRSVLAEFMEWEGAYFCFEALSIPDHGEIEVDAKDFLLEHGLAAEQVLFELLDPEGLDFDDPSEVSAEEESSVEHQEASLWSLMNEIQPAEFTGEITLRILAQSRKYLRRGALFGVFRDWFRRMNHFGTPDSLDETTLRELSVPAKTGSLLDRVVDSRRSFRGPLPDSDVDRQMVHGLGGGAPSEVVAIPMIVGGRVVAILYGDDGSHGTPIESTDRLELQLAEIGLAMERAALEKRLRHLDLLRRQKSG